jgi:ParB/RepB/Spo0J family partition protein
MTKPTLMMVLLKNITIGTTNPRKAFDEDAINELAVSVKAKGVIQPILLRLTAKKDIYELVCGERRYRASMLVKLTEIPAYIKELTDDEALELQITENLQRKDVHPLEEAIAFKQLLERHTMVEVAARVGKKDYFIKQRIKLNDLVPMWQKVFYKNLVSLNDALKIAVLIEESQNMIIERNDVDDETIAKGTHIKIDDWYFRSFRGKLNDASFDISDKNLDKSVGDCNSCKFNSACANLFPEDAKTPICSNLPCFHNKSQLYFQRELKKVLEDPAIILISNNYEVDKKTADKYRKEGHEVLNNMQYEAVDDDDNELPVWEEFKNDNEDDFDTAEELEKAFNDDIIEYNEKKSKTEKKIASGKYLKAFYVEGNKTGKYTYVELKKNKSGSGNIGCSSKDAIASGTANALEIDNEIERIKTREKRSKELDAEKVHKLITDAMKGDKSLKELPAAFTPTDKVLMYFLISEYTDYSNRDLIKKVIGFHGGVWNESKGDKLYKQLEAITDQQLAFLVRIVVFQKYGNNLPGGNSGFMVDKRIAGLQEQKKSLKPKPEPKAKAPAKKKSTGKATA